MPDLRRRSGSVYGGIVKKECDLNGVWQIRPVERFSQEYLAGKDSDKDWLELTVPGQWQQHPQLQTHQGKVVYRRVFAFEGDPAATYALHFEGIFYAATVYLNGKRLGGHEGYFVPLWCLAPGLQKGANVLIVEVECLSREAEAENRQIMGIFHNLRYFPAAFNPGGIWGAVGLYAVDRYAIRHVLFHTISLTANSATVEIQVCANSLHDENATAQFSIEPLNFEGPGYQWHETVRLRKGANTDNFNHSLATPKIWWTHDIGFPAVYRLTVRYVCNNQVCESYTMPVGVRTVRIEKKRFYLNNQTLFLRGCNYVPTRPFLSAAAQDLCEDDIKAAAAVHINCLRVRGHVALHDFYEACSLNGILVWQDFPLHGLYTKQIEPLAQKQFQEMLHLLGGHPCVAFWCCHDEPFARPEDAKTFWERLKARLGRYIGNWCQNVLDPKLYTIARSMKTGHIVVQSSGMWGLLGSPSDVHFHWSRAKWWLENFETMTHALMLNNRIVSDFGAESLPCAETQDEMPVKGRTDSPAAIDKSQANQARILKTFIENLRLLKYHKIWGFFLADSHDLFPTGGPGIRDAARRPKQAYEIVKEAMRPNCLIAKNLVNRRYQLGDVCLIPVFILNDTQQKHDDMTMHIKVRLIRKLFLETTMSTNVEADAIATQINTIFFRPQQSGLHHLWLSLLQNGTEEPILTQYDLPII